MPGEGCAELRDSTARFLKCAILNAVVMYYQVDAVAVSMLTQLTVFTAVGPVCSLFTCVMFFS